MKLTDIKNQPNQTSENSQAELPESDISGLMAASALNKSWIITAKTSEGQTKKFRVNAQSANVAKEKFLKHYNQAEILDVKQEELEENLKKWFDEKWVRFGPDGKIRGDCARGDDSEGKPKCLPQSKAHALGKKGRASAAAKKRREDPNPERRGAAKNVATKVREQQCPECGGAMYPDTMIMEKQDACYYKVKSRYKVWPSAYASGALVQCRKKGAKNWGKKTEGVAEGYLPDESEMKTVYRATAPDGTNWEVKEYQGDYLTFVNGKHNNTYHATTGMLWGAKERAIEVVKKMAKQGVAEGSLNEARDIRIKRVQELSEALSVDDLAKVPMFVVNNLRKAAYATSQEAKETKNAIFTAFNWSKATPEEKQAAKEQLVDVAKIAAGLAIAGAVGHVGSAVAGVGHAATITGTLAQTTIEHIISDIGIEAIAEILATAGGINIVKNVLHSITTSSGRKFEKKLAPEKGVAEGSLNEFAPDEGSSSRKFIPWPEFIASVKEIVGKDFDVVENVIKSTIKARFVPHDPMEYGPTMLYSYYEARLGRTKGAVSTRGSIQIGKYVPNTSKLGTQNYITSFNLLKGHKFERHFDLTFDNVYEIANIIKGNTQGAYQMQPQGVAEGRNKDGVDTSAIEPGDRVTWWYNKFHPNYEGIVRKVQGGSIIVYAPGSGQLYQLTGDDIRSHEKKGVAEGRFDEPLTGWHIVYRKSGNPVHATPSFETRDQAQKYLMTRMFANHQDYKVVHTADLKEGFTGRLTKDGTWRVFKDGKAVSVAGPFKNKEEASAWIKKQGVAEGSAYQYHVVSKLDGNVLASYKTQEEAQKNAHGNPVVSGSLETIGDRQYIREQGVAEGGYQDDSKDREENLRYARSRNPVADAIRKKLNPNQKSNLTQDYIDAIMYQIETKHSIWASQYGPDVLFDVVEQVAQDFGQNNPDASLELMVQQVEDKLNQYQQQGINEKWSAKYKRSINCNNPRGFSQRAHCQGRKKNEDSSETFTRDPELYRARQKAKQHYTSVSAKDAFDKLTQRRLDHAEHDDRAQDEKIAELSAALSKIEAEMFKLKHAESVQAVKESKPKQKTWSDLLHEATVKFNTKLSEGGNLSSKSPGWRGIPGDHEAHTIDLKIHNRGIMVPILNNLLNSINNSFRINTGSQLWSPKNLKSRKFLSGSSLHFFNTDIADADFERVKPKVGDIDTQINKQAEPELVKWLDSSLGKVIGNGKLVGYSRGNEQYSSMWELTDPPIKVQIDLEFVDYTSAGEPTDWAGFSHSSSWEDLSQGIKGVFHKFIIQALAKLTTQDFLLRKLVGRGKARAEQDVPTRDSMLSFAVSSKEGGGLRPKYEPVVDSKGRPVTKDGVAVMQALPAAGYEKDIGNIFQSIFDKKINKATLKKVLPKTWSFVGILDIMNLVLSPEEKEQVMEAFVEKLFAPGAQGLYKGDPQRDLSEKNAALNYAYKVLKVSPPADLEQMRQDYVKNYRVVAEKKTTDLVDEADEPKVKAQLRQGMPHLRDLKPADFLDLIDELKSKGGRFKLANIPLNVKIDGLGARFGKDSQGKPFMGTSRTEPRYKADFLDYHKNKGTQDPVILDRAANYDKLFNEIMFAIEAIDSALGADFLVNKQVTAEMLYLPFASETPEGKLKFVGIEYDKLPQGTDLVIVPYKITDSATGQDLGSEAVQKIANLGQLGNTMFVSNRLAQTNALDVTEIINVLDNLPELSNIVQDTQGKRDRASLALRREVEAKLKPVQIALEKAIDEDPNIVGKTKLGQDYEGIVINSRLGPIKVTSQRQKDIIAQKNAARAQTKTSGKTAVVAIGSFVGHIGHQQLWDLTIKQAQALNADPYLFMGSAVGKDDPIPVADKVKTWQLMYPQYANNISAVTQEGGTLMQKIKHELINPQPGKPPRYDNIIIMVGADQAKMPIAQALMKAVNKFQGYEHVKVMLEPTARGTGMSFTQLRNSLKTGTQAEQFNIWNNAFNSGGYGAKPLPATWIKHLMQAARAGMGLTTNKTESQLKTLNQLIKEGLAAKQCKT